MPSFDVFSSMYWKTSYIQQFPSTVIILTIHDKDQSEWNGLAFELCLESTFDVATATVKPKAKKWFRVILNTAQNSRRRPISFTLRFRAKGEAGWKWVSSQSPEKVAPIV